MSAFMQGKVKVKGEAVTAEAPMTLHITPPPPAVLRQIRLLEHAHLGAPDVVGHRCGDLVHGQTFPLPGHVIGRKLARPQAPGGRSA